MVENEHKTCESAIDTQTLIKNASVLPFVGENKPKKVLIATLYTPEPVILACTRLGPDKLILIIDKEPDATLSKSLELIKGSLGKVIDVQEVKTDAYDIVDTARKCVEVIDCQGKDDEIYANVTAGRKTRAIGLLFASYARHERVLKIAYNPEEDKKAIVWLPRLSFHLSENEKMILEKLDTGKFESIKDLADKLGEKNTLSTAMVYRAIDALKDMDLLVTEPKLELTDAGRIARL